MGRDVEAIELELLVLRCQRGEREAFEELVGTWERRLIFYVRRLVADEADAWQILQEVWLQVLRGIHSLRDPGRLPVWLYAVARTTALAHHRKGYARRRALEAAGRPGPAASDDPTRLEAAELVRYGLSRIPPVDREVLTLFFLRDLAVAEVAEVLGIPPGTVKSRLFKAKRSLREALKNQGVSDA